jgi:hypothetical protein
VAGPDRSEIIELDGESYRRKEAREHELARRVKRRETAHLAK